MASKSEPRRQRPGASSALKLEPLVEPVNIPLNNTPETPEPAHEATEPAAPETSPEAPAEAPLAASPEQSPPAAAGPSPLDAGSGEPDESETALQDAGAQPESVTEAVTLTSGGSELETQVAAPAPEPKAEAAHVPAPEVYIPPNMKQPVTINMRTALKLRAETAVLRTGHLPGGYRSQVMLIEAALERELTRLETEFNNGEPFPPNVGSFRTGRPLGS